MGRTWYYPAFFSPSRRLPEHGLQRGNPIGGLMYSTQFANGEGPVQVIEWTKCVVGFLSSRRRS
jgi:hypothetical protein